jgi:cysteine desulfurase
MRRSTYLDYNATTPVRPAVMEAVGAALAGVGNPSSVHGFGRAARARLETAREQVAALVGVISSRRSSMIPSSSRRRAS